jgi:hypothetical protein
MKSVLICVWDVSVIAAIVSMAVEGHFHGAARTALSCYMPLGAIALAILTGALLAKMTKNWLYLIGAIPLPFLLIRGET